MSSTENQDLSAGLPHQQQQPQQSPQQTAQQHQVSQQLQQVPVQTSPVPAPPRPLPQMQQQPVIQQQQVTSNQAQGQIPLQQQQQQQQQQQPTGQSHPSPQAVHALLAAPAPPTLPPPNLPQVNQTASNNPLAPGALDCQWQGCAETCPTPEALYEHVCERHVGRKSTNNLNLTCGWANCRTTTVKRDHITSHIRVHVPLKPHKCDFCGKAFKRPQDLKKHVKTHADDSVLVRSPDPGSSSRQPPSGMFGVGVGPDGKRYPVAPHYFEGSLGPVPQAPYGHPPPQYYQPQHPQHPTGPSYGNVYYAVGQHDAHQASYESKKRGYDALNEFFGDMKRRQFDPTSYAAVGQRLLNLHGLPLPLAQGGAVPEYQPMPAMVNVGGHGGGYHAAPVPTQSYHLPPMGSLRTKADLMNIDQFLEQMQSTVYESDDNVAAAGIAQPGAHYVQGPLSYRTTNSPPTASHLPSSGHATATTTSAPMITTTSAARSPHSSTPALTPPSSAQSYTSGRSPISLSSSHGLSPSHPHHHHSQHQQHNQSAQSTSGLYPTLPATTAQEMSAGYPTVSTAAPPSTLSSGFDGDDRRRYTGGMLQRSRPNLSVSPDMQAFENQQESKVNVSTNRDTPLNVSSNLIDPALRRASVDAHSAHSHSQSSPSDQGSSSATPEGDERAQSGTRAAGADRLWVENVRLLQRLRDYVLNRLNNGDYIDDGEELISGRFNEEYAGEMKMMHGMEAIAAAAVAHEHQRLPTSAESRVQHHHEQLEPEPAAPETETEEVKAGSGPLYPVLQMEVPDADGDQKMTEDQ
ncbi:hypothetical protein FQN57_004776 [Myotisia sp. PD_48]|nr:hypothetical protein FQN57_004776 [Myotisia sp. PD_48]